MEAIRLIRSFGKNAAMSIKPATPAEALFPYLPELDMALVMTVEPGFGGQKLIPETVEKVRALRRYALKNGLSLDIEVDGGISADNLRTLTEAGANVIVAGSAIFKAEYPAAVIGEMISIGEKYPFDETK